MYFSKISLNFLAICSSAASFTFTFQNGGSSSGLSSQHKINKNKIQHHQLNLSDRGWDNGGFLDALGGGEDDMANVNKQYQLEAEQRSAAMDRKFQSMDMNMVQQGQQGQQPGQPYDPDDFVLNNMAAYEDESPIPTPNVANEETPGGGDRFKRMMEQAKQHQGQDGRRSNMMQQPQEQQQFNQQFGQQQPQQQFNQPPANAQPYQPPPPPPQPQQAIPPPQPQQAQAQAPMDPQGYYQALQAWQQAMVAFQQFSAANPAAAAQMTPPPPPPPPVFAQPGVPAAPAAVPPPVQAVQQQQYQAPPPPPPPAVPQQQQPSVDANANADTGDEVNTDNLYDLLPKKAGGNNDAYEVNNSADVYFAQLKRDSSVRIAARKKGDLETANKPFAEKGVVALGGLLSEELINKRRERLAQNGGEFETSRDEMILPSHFQDDGTNKDLTTTGTSYKERLMEAKKRRKSQN